MSLNDRDYQRLMQAMQQVSDAQMKRAAHSEFEEGPDLNLRELEDLSNILSELLRVIDSGSKLSYGHMLDVLDRMAMIYEGKGSDLDEGLANEPEVLARQYERMNDRMLRQLERFEQEVLPAILDLQQRAQ